MNLHIMHQKRISRVSVRSCLFHSGYQHLLNSPEISAKVNNDALPSHDVTSDGNNTAQKLVSSRFFIAPLFDYFASLYKKKKKQVIYRLCT